MSGLNIIKSIKPPVDSDHDGIPDEEELRVGLDPMNSIDAGKISKSGYSYLEEYINKLCDIKK